MDKTFVGAKLVGKLSAAALLVAVAAGCGAGSSSEDVGVARLAITQAPADVRCLRLTVAGSNRTVKRDVDVTPGQSTEVTIGGLPLGTDTFSGEAFPVECAAVTTTDVPSWVGDPVTADVAVNPPVTVPLVLRRNGRANVSIDFEDDGTGGAGGTGGTGGTGGAGGTGGTAATISFASPQTTSVPAPVAAMVAGHFTTNFNSDLVVVTTAPSSQLMVFQGMNGGFGPPRTLSSFSVPVNQVVSADLNNDGIGDLVVSLTTAAPQVMLGTFSGQFEVLAPLNVPPATAVAVFDMDGDGLADIVTASSTPAGLSVSRNNGDGSFQLIESTASPSFTQIAVGFLDGDGVADLVGCDTFSGVSIAHGVVPGLIGPMQFVTTLPAPANAIGLVDGNGNGLPDALFATSAGLFLVDGVTGAPQTLLTISSTGLAVADLNGDGLLDVATLTDPGATILRNVGAALVVDGTAQTSVPPPGLLTFAELNGAARPALVAASSLLPVLTSALNTTP